MMAKTKMCTDMRVSERLVLMVHVILICPAKADAFTTTTTSWLRTTTSHLDTTTIVLFDTTTTTAPVTTTTTTSPATTNVDTTTGTAPESTTTPTTGTMPVTAVQSFGVTTETSATDTTSRASERSSATDVTWLASSTLTSETRTTTEEMNTPSTVKINNSTVVTCEKSTEVEGLEAKLAAVTALAAVFGVTSAMLLVLLLFLHRGSIVLKWRELCSESQSERRNRNQLQMGHQFNTNSHIYTDLRRDSQGENLGLSENDAPVYVNAGQASGDVVYCNTGRSLGTFRP